MKSLVSRRQFLSALGALAGASGCANRQCVDLVVLTPVSGPSIQPPGINQFAFTVLNLDRTRAWYHDMLGFLPSGGTDGFGNILGSWVQGLPQVEVRTKWMMDRQEFFQLEMFEYSSPVSKPRPVDRKANDIGYAIAGMHVADFDARLAFLRNAGVKPLGGPLGAPGRRRVCIQDPEGNLLELMEEDPRQTGNQRPRPLTAPVVMRSMTLSVPSLERSRRFFVDTIGLEECRDFILHAPEHEELWGLKGASSQSLLLWAGDMLVELKEYTDPKGKPWPDGYRISDQGYMNIAFGFRTRRAFIDCTDRLEQSGYRGNSPAIHFFDWGVQYVNDDQCFSVELLFVEPEADKRMGFVPE